ncbi:S-adenosyl-L-methionine-dependent methyltransferase [Trichoderma camerunense]
MATNEETFRAYTQKQGELYAADRPGYSPALFKFIIDHHKSTGGELVTFVDVGCGTGQATCDLAQYFSEAIGLDPSEGMIGIARASAKSALSPVRFDVSAAEDLGTDLEPPIAENSVDLLTAATAAHWFDLERFWLRASRILKPGGTVALWARTGMSIDPTQTPNGSAIKAALEAFHSELLPYERQGGILARDLYADLPLPWTLDNPVKAFDQESFVREVWNRHRVYEQDAQGADFGTRRMMTPGEFEKLLGTHSTVTRWREDHPDLADTEKDIVRNLRRKIESLLHDVGVEPGEEILRGGVAIVLLMVKKTQQEQ